MQNKEIMMRVRTKSLLEQTLSGARDWKLEPGGVISTQLVIPIIEDKSYSAYLAIWKRQTKQGGTEIVLSSCEPGGAVYEITADKFSPVKTLWDLLQSPSPYVFDEDTARKLKK